MRRALLSLALAALVPAVAAACGGGEPEIVEVSGPAQETTPLAQVQESEIALTGGPDWTTAYEGFVWVKRDDGFVTRIDPATNEPSGEVRADTKSDQYCQGIGSGEGAVWSCSGGDVVRIDPKTLEVVASIPVGKVFTQGRLVVANGHLWVLTGEGDRLTGIDTGTNRAGPEIELPFACSELGPGVDTVWVLCPTANRVVAVDVAEMEVRGDVEVEAPAAGFGTATDAWILSQRALIRIDAESLDPVARFTALADPRLEGDVAVDGEDVWVRTDESFLHRVDASSNVVAEQIELEEPLSSGAVILHEGSIWTTAFNDELVLRLRA
jgi:outer membrane protein assembly factor BamB